MILLKSEQIEMCYSFILGRLLGTVLNASRPILSSWWSQSAAGDGHINTQMEYPELL